MPICVGFYSPGHRLPSGDDDEAGIADEVFPLLPCRLGVLVEVAQDPVEDVWHMWFVLETADSVVSHDILLLLWKLLGLASAQTYHHAHLYAVLDQPSDEALEFLILPTTHSGLEDWKQPDHALQGCESVPLAMLLRIYPGHEGQARAVEGVEVALSTAKEAGDELILRRVLV